MSITNGNGHHERLWTLTTNYRPVCLSTDRCRLSVDRQGLQVRVAALAEILTHLLTYSLPSRLSPRLARLACPLTTVYFTEKYKN